MCGMVVTGKPGRNDRLQCVLKKLQHSRPGEIAEYDLITLRFSDCHCLYCSKCVTRYSILVVSIKNIDSQSHIMWCPSLVALREGLDNHNDLNVVSYYQQVIMLRETLPGR